MAGSFLRAAAKQVVDISSFLREAAGGNSIKYVAEAGKKHRVYIVPVEVEQEVDGVVQKVKTINAIMAKVHEGKDSSGKYYATACLEDIHIKTDDGIVVNDGTCPFCKRESDAWDVYNYRMEMEEATCILTGENRKKHLENCKTNFADERKAKKANNYLYMLVVKFKTTDNGDAVTGDNGLPVYELKVMRLSASRVEKIQKQLKNSGIEMVGQELIFDYPNEEDRRLVVSGSTVSPVFGDAQFVVKYPALLEQINRDVEQFDFDGVAEAFKELKGMSTSEASKIMEDSFEEWDKYQKAKLINPMAKYLEYANETPVNNPSLQIPTGPMVQTAATPIVPQVAGMVSGVPQVPVIPTGQINGQQIQMPHPTVGNANPQATPQVTPQVATPQVTPQVAVGGQGVATNANAIMGGANGNTGKVI